MRTVVLAAVAITVLTTSWSVAQAGEERASFRAKVCHRTTSASRPYRLVTVRSRAALRRHERHANDIVPAPAGGCPRRVLSPTVGGRVLEAFLLGAFEQPQTGDRDGMGRATFRLQAGLGRVCYVVSVRQIALPSAGAHIHTGAMGTAGGILVQLNAPGAGGTSRGCASTSRGTVRRILASPAGFYANVHTTEFPGGAIRGQLETLPAGATVLVAAMTGDQERRTGDPNTPTGDPDGMGAGVFRITGAQICYTLIVRDIRLPAVGAHIHRGPALQNGPIVVPFNAPDASGVSSACTNAEGALVQEITANPAGFYSNVHTSDFPAGAVRGQLTAP